jgi:predicted nicotinamide N-methyase
MEDHEEEDIIRLDISDHNFLLSTAAEEYNFEKKTLFATVIWEGSKVLSRFLFDEGHHFVSNSKVVEFGAGDLNI